ncbi:MAG: hypothetical protein ACI8Z1_002045, partial [Candidatus Azotimanducaceae bacterium]
MGDHHFSWEMINIATARIFTNMPEYNQNSRSVIAFHNFP